MGPQGEGGKNSIILIFQNFKKLSQNQKLINFEFFLSGCGKGALMIGGGEGWW